MCSRLLHRQTEVLVDERNDRIKEKVLGWPSPPARIFCVSAKDYRENAIGYRLGEVGKLPIEVERSEIPALMRYIAALSAQSQQRGLVTYISNTIPSLLNSLEIAFSHVASTYRFVLPGGIDGQLKVRTQNFSFVDGRTHESSRAASKKSILKLPSCSAIAFRESFFES